MKHNDGKSLKGKQFKVEDLGKATAAKMTSEQREAWCAEQTKRWEVVAYDYDELDEEGKPRPIVREELDERALRKLPFAARIAATMVQRLTSTERAIVLAAFDKKGNLIHPWPLKGTKGFKVPE